MAALAQFYGTSPLKTLQSVLEDFCSFGIVSSICYLHPTGVSTPRPKLSPVVSGTSPTEASVPRPLLDLLFSIVLDVRPLLSLFI